MHNERQIHAAQLRRISEGIRTSKFVRQNIDAIKTLEEEMKMDVESATHKHHAADIISYLRVLGLTCSTCGSGTISLRTLEQFGYSPFVRCHSCQQLSN